MILMTRRMLRAIKTMPDGRAGRKGLMSGMLDERSREREVGQRLRLRSECRGADGLLSYCKAGRRRGESM